ncbi:unnamed protein product [Clonostachys rosea]|uniref:Bud22 domain-containing protein n=1 Tax=Bionectria ochroleuca TaxID=29856 RepID=A0ABY6USD5_BIOOC|nr:unnamed protein product [Clonostachys rosea]
MSKRKRNSEPTLQDQLTKSQDDLFKALKAAKGFERQRLSKRLHEAGITPDKQERLEREVAVLKSLELHQTARAHLFSSLLKVKAIAASTDLPDEIRTGVPKPELSEEERSALHNVTSGLYNRKPVKDVVDRAVESVCKLLKVPVPAKGKQGKKDKRKDTEDQPADRISQKAEDEVSLPPESGDEVDGVADKVTDFEGFSDDGKPGPEVADDDSVSEGEEGDDEEGEFAEYDGLLGSSSEDEDEEFNDKRYDQFRGREKVNLDDISVSGSDADVEVGEESEDDEEDEEQEEEQDPESEQSSSPPPPAKKTKRSKDPGPIRDSTFLPSLMGGYMSGSESASDVDVEAPKKRRGQRARQAIWEKKFGAKAKHLQREKRKGGRDAGWDMRRGAVDGDDQGRRTPWKKGVSNPFLNKGRGDGDGSGFQPKPQPPKPTKRDDEGVLHPSWEAAKKAKDAQKAIAFSGAKIVFD